MTAHEIHVAGVSFIDGYPSVLHQLGLASVRGRDLTAELRRNPSNPHDANAIEVYVCGSKSPVMVGHLPADVAAVLAPRIDSGEEWVVALERVVISPENPDRPGLVVRVESHPDNATGGTTMGTALPTGSKTKAPPSLKLRNVGDEVKFAVVDVKLGLPMTEFGTGNPKLNAAGNQMTQHALTVLVIEPGQAVTPDGNGGYDPAVADELHTIYIGSYAKWDPDRDAVTAPFKSWGGITDEVGLEVGYVGAWKFIEELAPSRAGNNPRKDRKFRLRAPQPTENELVARCEALHAELHASGGTPLPTDQHDEVEPF